MDLKFVHRLSDNELLARVEQLARDERHATAALVAHLSEMERRQLYLEQGCRSLFTYCTQVLHLSEHAAYNRIEAARIALRFPAVLTHLAAGQVHLTAIRLLAPCLTADNQVEMLTAAKHRSKREVEEMVARLRPLACASCRGVRPRLAWETRRRIRRRRNRRCFRSKSRRQPVTAIPRPFTNTSPPLRLLGAPNLRPILVTTCTRPTLDTLDARPRRPRRRRPSFP